LRTLVTLKQLLRTPRRRIYLHKSFTRSMRSSVPILRLTSDKSWSGTTSRHKMHRQYGKSYPMTIYTRALLGLCDLLFQS
jgi:hypothetical protein